MVIDAERSRSVGIAPGPLLTKPLSKKNDGTHSTCHFRWAMSWSPHQEYSLKGFDGARAWLILDWPSWLGP